jgi:hypothetical protein
MSGDRPARHGGSCSDDVSGSRRGASDRRRWAVPGDVWRMKLLVRRHVATFGYRLVSYGMQEVRGSNPRSSTGQTVYGRAADSAGSQSGRADSSYRRNTVTDADGS